MKRRYALRDDQWLRIKDLLPGREGSVGVTAKDNRLFIEAVLYRYRAGIPWRDLPTRFGDFRVVHTRFTRWAKQGIWNSIFQQLAADADNEYAMIDEPDCSRPPTQCWRKRGDAQKEAIGRSRGGLSTKIHATVDALGNPLSFYLTPGQASDLEGADELLTNLQAKTIIADKGYDADERVRDLLKNQDKTPVIPCKKNRKMVDSYDRELYKARHLIENFFARLKQYRAIATRYDKRATNFLGGIYLAAIVVWLN